MSSISMTGEAAEPGASISWKFVAFWPLSFVVPSLILTFVRIAIFSFVQDDDLAYKAALLLPIPCWLLIAYLQLRLLRPYFRRSGLWLIATFVGGNLGGFAGGLAQLQTMSMLEQYAYDKVLISDYNSVIHSDWIFAIAPTASIVAGVFVGAAILGFLQSLCLDGPLGARLLWILVSALSGIAAAAFGYGCYWGYFWAMFMTYPRAVVSAGMAPQLITVAVGLICGAIVYGLLTGAVLRRLLTRSAGLRKEALIAQFE
jgi:hypothetical protein